MPSRGPARPLRSRAGSPSGLRGIPRRVLWGAWWRWLFFLHASYNYERLQGLGFAHAMKPVIDHLYPTVAGRAAALKRLRLWLSNAAYRADGDMGSTAISA